MSIQRLIGIAAIVLVIVGVGLGFSMTGPPAEMRQRSFDDSRVRDLATLAERIQRCVRHVQHHPAATDRTEPRRI